MEKQKYQSAYQKENGREKRESVIHGIS